MRQRLLCIDALDPCRPCAIRHRIHQPRLGRGVTVEKSGYRLEMAQGNDSTGAATDGCNPSGTAANLFSSYYASNQPLYGGLTGNRWFWTNSLGTIFVSTADDFDAEDAGNAPPSVGLPLQ